MEKKDDIHASHKHLAKVKITTLLQWICKIPFNFLFYNANKDNFAAISQAFSL